MVQTPIKYLMLEDFLRSPETEPASEYINGQIVQKPCVYGIAMQFWEPIGDSRCIGFPMESNSTKREWWD